MDKDAQVTQIGYYDDKHTMCIKIYNTNGYFPEYQMFLRKTEITPKEKEDHENQLRNTGNLILSPDYIPLPTTWMY